MSDDDLKSDFIKTNCMSMCPIECGQIIYKTTCSFMQLTGYPFIFELKERSKLKADFVQRVIDLSETRMSIVKVNIFYESLSFILTAKRHKWMVLSCWLILAEIWDFIWA